MFEFLKDMLGVPRPIEVIGYEEPEVVFQCDSSLDLGLVGVIADIEGVKIKAQIQVVEIGSDTNRALWIAPQEALELLIETYTPSEKRHTSRLSRKLRVRSAKLENFQGITLDLSRTGMRIEGKGDFVPGEQITITFDLDDSRQTKITTQVQLSWIGPSEKEGWKAMGLRYLDLNIRDQSQSFSYYCEFLESIR